MQEKERKAEFSWFEWEEKLTMKLGVYIYKEEIKWVVKVNLYLKQPMWRRT